MSDNTRKPGFSTDLVSGQPIGQHAMFQLDENGDYQPIGPSSPLFNYSFLLAVSRGLIPGHTIFEKFGRNPDIDGGPEDVWNGGGVYTGFPTGSAETIDLSSLSDEDGAGGSTGLLTIRLFGQLAGVEQTEDVILNGTTKVTTVKLWDRMNRMRGLTAGSTGSNVGEITAQHTTTTANIFAKMPALSNRTQIGAFTVPAGKTLYLKLFDPRIVLSAGLAASGTMAIMARESGTAFEVFEQTQTLDLTTGGPAPLPVDCAVSYPALTDVVARLLSVSTNNVSGSAQFFGVLVDD